MLIYNKMNQRFNKVLHISDSTTPNSFVYNISGVIPNSAKKENT